MQKVTTEQRQTRLADRHFLATEAPDVETVAHEMVGLHATDPVTVYLSCRARVAGFTKEDLERSLYETHALVRTLGMRRTLFVVPEEHFVLLQHGCAQRYVAAERRQLTQLLVDQHGFDESWLDEVERRTLEAVGDLGEPTAKDLVAAVPELSTKIAFGEGKKWGGQVGVSTRVLFLLATSGSIVRGRPLGSWLSSQYRWVLRDRWLADPPGDVTPEQARARLAELWLRGFGPGTVNDLKWWSGWGVGETRSALDDIGALPVALDDGEGVALPEHLDFDAGRDWASLLPSLDPTPMGWKDRDWFLGDHRAALYDRNGNIGPTVWLNGRIVGGWAVAADGEVRVRVLEPVSGEHRSLIDERAAELAEWLGGEALVPRFRTPLEKDLMD